MSCCGYADCQNKKCEGQTAVDVNGTLYACCGKENCNQVYEDNKFKGCGLEKTINYTARALEQKCLHWGSSCQNPSGTNQVCHDVCTKYSSAYYPTYILERCTSTSNISCGTTGCHGGECTSTTTAWTGQISIIDYPVTGSRQNCETKTMRNTCYAGDCQSISSVANLQCATGYCHYTQTFQSCTKVNTYDLTCAPRTPYESQWYGRTVFTNYENCVREHGSFAPIPVSNRRSDVGYCTVK